MNLLEFVTPDSRVRVVLSLRSGLVLSLVLCGGIGPSTAFLANQAPVYCGCPAGTHGCDLVSRVRLDQSGNPVVVWLGHVSRVERSSCLHSQSVKERCKKGEKSVKKCLKEGVKKRCIKGVKKRCEKKVYFKISKHVSGIRQVGPRHSRSRLPPQLMIHNLGEHPFHNCADVDVGNGPGLHANADICVFFGAGTLSARVKK